MESFLPIQVDESARLFSNGADPHQTDLLKDPTVFFLWLSGNDMMGPHGLQGKLFLMHRYVGARMLRRASTTRRGSLA
ncbi:hypothetical protein CHELA40_30166 [Chelatococcus asaccharovorans]|nr:hypothetical protein CHELA17_40248 [Chelatococcus asaccharovorans]CAH1688176.1 hypothetical protein CHELA40_30166 [Chelatococcus asaccharovorans]